MGRNRQNRFRESIPIPQPAPLPEPEVIDVGAVLNEYLSGAIDLIVVLGPTASGKTRYAASLARRITDFYHPPYPPDGGKCSQSLRLRVPAPPVRRIAPHSGAPADAGLSHYSTVPSASVGSVPSATVATLGHVRGGTADEVGGGAEQREALPEGTASHDGPRCEILSADSRQVYRGMDIGTGKDLDEYGDVPYHLIDIVPAGTRFDLFQWRLAFEEAYKAILERGNIPILCGGTGLYIQAAVEGYSLRQVPPDEELREKLERLSAEELIERLSEFGPLPDEGVLQSKRRIVRALEIALYEKDHPVKVSAFPPKKPYYIGTLVSREERNARIDARLDARLQGGLIEEVKRLLDSGIKPEDLMYYGLEYKFVTQHVLGILTYDEMRILLSNAIHQFAKRQMTWFRGMEKDDVKIHWTNV